jgi:hypothetical protein
MPNVFQGYIEKRYGIQELKGTFNSTGTIKFGLRRGMAWQTTSENSDGNRGPYNKKQRPKKSLLRKTKDPVQRVPFRGRGQVARRLMVLAEELSHSFPKRMATDSTHLRTLAHPQSLFSFNSGLIRNLRFCNVCFISSGHCRPSNNSAVGVRAIWAPADASVPGLCSTRKPRHSWRCTKFKMMPKSARSSIPAEDVNGRIADMWTRPELGSYEGDLVSRTSMPGKYASGTSTQSPALVQPHRRNLIV